LVQPIDCVAFKPTIETTHLSVVYFGDEADAIYQAFEHSAARTQIKFTYLKTDQKCAAEYNIKAPGIAIFHGSATPV
jgi:hypothetical protein